MLKVYGRKTSINVQKVMWTVGELGLDHERIDAEGVIGTIEKESPGYRELCPNGLVPAIDDDGTVVWQSNTIVRYIAAKYGMGGLCPADPAERAQADAWMDWQTTDVWREQRLVFLGLVRTPPEQRNMDQINAALNGTHANMGILDNQLQGRDFIMGDTLTIADIAVGVTVQRYYAMDIERPSLPNAEAYYARLMQREPYRTHTDFTLV